MSFPNAKPARPLPSTGEYLCSERELYQVERVLDDGALIEVEDCRTNALVEVTIDELLALRPVRPAPHA